MTEFKDFGLAEPIVRAIAEEGYTVPTPIQVQAIPVVMAGGVPLSTVTVNSSPLSDATASTS